MEIVMFYCFFCALISMFPLTNTPEKSGEITFKVHNSVNYEQYQQITYEKAPTPLINYE